MLKPEHYDAQYDEDDPEFYEEDDLSLSGAELFVLSLSSLLFVAIAAVCIWAAFHLAGMVGTEEKPRHEQDVPDAYFIHNSGNFKPE